MNPFLIGLIAVLSVSACGGSVESTEASSSSGSSGSSGSSSSTSSGSSMTQTTVPCAGNPCMPGQVCCHHAGQPMQDTCGAAGSCAGGTAELSCHGPADCPGATCCGEWDPMTMDYTIVNCQPTCVTGGGKIRILQCEGDPSVCPMGESCYMSPLLGKGYSFCQ